MERERNGEKNSEREINNSLIGERSGITEGINGEHDVKILPFRTELKWNPESINTNFTNTLISTFNPSSGK